MKRQEKIKRARELEKMLEVDSTLEVFGPVDLTRIGYAPLYGYTAWMFCYKEVPVVLWDFGNGHYGFSKRVSKLSVVLNKVYTTIGAIRYSLK